MLFRSTCKQKHVRQMPGRIVGRTTDLDDKPGFALTLQAREQHIRRSKATSNICTNQGLMVTAATIYMSLLGIEGLARVARKSHANTVRLVAGLCAIDGVERLYDGPYFHEVALKLDRPVAPVLETLAARNILAGYDLSSYAGMDALLEITLPPSQTSYLHFEGHETASTLGGWQRGRKYRIDTIFDNGKIIFERPPVNLD